MAPPSPHEAAQELRLSFHFLAPQYHGRCDDGQPEWPPSPLRAMQALVAAAARAGTLQALRPALLWLQAQPAPLILAPAARSLGSPLPLYVPHNQKDLTAAKWARGLEVKDPDTRTMKTVQPLHLTEGAGVHYLWPLPADGSAAQHAQALADTARHVVALGWGVDLVAGHGQLQALGSTPAEPGQEPWRPHPAGRTVLRTPAPGTLEQLDRRHASFLQRTSLADPTFRPPEPLRCFHRTAYARADESHAPAAACFTLRRMKGDALRAFDTSTQGMAVAGMLRFAVRRAAEAAAWPPKRVTDVLMGHGPGDSPRLLLLPVPTLEARPGGGRVLGAVRRVMLLAHGDAEPERSWLQRALAGAELVDQATGEVQALLAAAAESERGFAPYCGSALIWTSATPVVLPGMDDPGGLRRTLRSSHRDAAQQHRALATLQRRQEELVRKALRQAGLSETLVATAAIECRATGFLAGVEPAARHAVPSHLRRYPRLHVRITFAQDVAGPLCIGRGRFSGLGLLCAFPATAAFTPAQATHAP